MNHALVVAALRADLAMLLPRAERLGVSASEAWNVLVVVLLRDVLRRLAPTCAAEQLADGRLFRTVPAFQADERAKLREKLASELTAPQLTELNEALPSLPIEAFGQLYESLLAARPSDAERDLRKRTGSYYTPEALTQVVVERAFGALEQARGPVGLQQPLRILDPALGAGAFLVQAGRNAARVSGRSLQSVVAHELFGVDVSPLAVAVAEASLWLLASTPGLTLGQAGAQLREGDALCSPEAGRALGRRGVDFSELSATGFDLVLGNPPWVAFAGRATQPLAPPLRQHYRDHFAGFRGYPTLHALFVELSARLAPSGVLALLIPSPLADLEGYRPVRSALVAAHQPCEPLLELGQDAFASVTQPCFALVAAPRPADRAPEPDPGRPWVLSERARAATSAAELRTPPALARLAALPRFPDELFGEMGLQTSSAITRQLLYRGNVPPQDFSYALLEGRNIQEFEIKAPRLFLKPDRQLLAQHRCRLRDASEYARVKLVVRQTAAITIAAAHDGTPFRNSLLAGFELPDFPFELTLGLLNSTLYRALHLAARRDARQGAFPQVKIAHLRALPAPPSSPARQTIAELARSASQSGLNAELRRALDAVVFDSFEVTPSEAQEITAFVRERSPKAGLVVELT